MADKPSRASSRNTPLSRLLNTGVRQKSAQPQKESCSGLGNRSSESYFDVTAKQGTGSCGQNSVIGAVSLVPDHVPPLQSGESVTPHLIVTEPLTSTPVNTPPEKSKSLLDILSCKQAKPLNWQYSEPNSADSSPLSSPKPTRRSRSATPSNKNRFRSPLLGLSSLRPKKGSQLSLEWDNFSSDPSYFGKIPIVATPSPSLASSSESVYQLFTPTSVIMAVKRCSKCHKFISGAPTSELEHTGVFGPECQGAHHPDSCSYMSKENSPCSFYANLSPRHNESQILHGAATNPISPELIQKNQELLLLMNRIDNLIRMFPVELMTLDRLKSYEPELEKIRDKYSEFSDKVVMFTLTFATSRNFIVTADGTAMNIEYWQGKELSIGQKMTDHQIIIRNRASELQSAKSMSEYERKEIEMKERELKLKEEQLNLMKQSQTRSEKAEKEKANALAQSKYDEILTLSIELDEFLDKTVDWSKASRSDVVTAMKSLDKWDAKFADLNKAHRDFVMATSIYSLPEESQKVEDIIEETTEKYKRVITDIQTEDKNRELYSLAGTNKEQVKLPKFGGSASEDFATFKAKLLLAFEKNMVPVSDKIEKLRTCLTGPALALVPEKSSDFAKALETLADAFGNPERVLSVRIGELKKVGKCLLP